MNDSPTHSNEVQADWYASAFDALYPVVYAHRTVEAAAPEAAFALKALEITSRDVVLDLCCGNGRHMVHLVPHARRVIGLDYSPHLLCLARRSLGGKGLLLRGDMRSLPFPETFDVVTNFFTSFGYFMDEAENRSVARGIGRVLRPSGRFLVDYLNADYVEANLVPESQRESAGYRIHERRWIDSALRRVNKVMEVSRGGRMVSRSSESVRLYTVREMTNLLGSAGLEVTALHGDYDGTPVANTRPRVILVGRKPAGHG